MNRPLIRIVPSSRKIPEYSTPLQAIRAGFSRHNTPAARKANDVVAGSTITDVSQNDVCVLFQLNNGARLAVKALAHGECIFSVNDPEDSELDTTNRVLGDTVDLEWPKIGSKTWDRIALLRGLIGREIHHIAAHDVGTSLYCVGRHHIMFSCVMRENGAPLLYWGLANA
jgi:hypothetical protein